MQKKLLLASALFLTYASPCVASTNTTLGTSAGPGITGTNNTAIGYESLFDFTTGNDTTAVGANALYSTTGSPNTAVGDNAGEYISSGSDNVALGYKTMQGVSASPITNGANTAVGDAALFNLQGNTYQDTAVGFDAGEYVSTGINEVAIGTYAMLGVSLTPLTGDENTAIGGAALGTIQGAAANDTAVGYDAGGAVTTGANNTLIGSDAGSDTTSGDDNVAIGVDSLSDNTTGTDNTAVGEAAMLGASATPLTGDYNTAVGATALEDAEGAATQNTAVGFAALEDTTTGQFNTAVGVAALADNTTAIESTAVGAYALQYATGGSNTAVGTEALSDLTTGTDSTAVGTNALESATGSPNDALGYEAGAYITSGSDNVAIGFEAMQGVSPTPLTGSYNTGVGNTALNAIQGAAANNTTLGYESGEDITTGSSNVIVGEGGNITTGSTNILIGNNLTQTTNTASNQIDIGDVIMVTGSSTPSTSTTTIQGNLVVNGSFGGTSAAIFSSGQLLCGGSNCSNSTGSTTLNYCPYKGNLKTTASQGTYTIPSGCLSATTTSMYKGGTSGQSLSANTLYYIYLWNHSGTWVLDAETTGHATDSNTGIEIESGDDTKTLVGMIETNSGKKVFTGGKTNVNDDTNTVATWDNRISTTAYCYFVGSSVTLTNPSGPTQLSSSSSNECYFMSWGDAASFLSGQAGYNSSATGYNETSIYIDGATEISNYPAEGTSLQPQVASFGYAPTEGYHYTTLWGDCTATTTGTWTAGGSLTSVLTLQ